MMLGGCNLTGGETDYRDWSGAPKSGTHYLFVSTADIDICLAAGMQTFRLLFSWEAYADATYRATLESRVAYITSKGATCILDIHPGDASLAPGKFGVKIANGSSLEADLCKLWAAFASQYRLNPLVEFGIFNEPNGIPVAQWFITAQKVITAIRTTGNTSWIWMPGANWTGAGDWVASNGSAWNLVDPIGKTGVQVHLYFDQNAGGGALDVVSGGIGVTRLTNTVTWARSRGLKVFLGEVGLQAGQPNANLAWTNLAAYMAQNSDVVQRWCWWAYGPPSWWSGYQFTLCGNSPQMKLAFPATTPAPVPIPVPSAPDPKDAQIASLTATVVDLQAKSSDLKSMVTNLQAKIAKAVADLG